MAVAVAVVNVVGRVSSLIALRMVLKEQQASVAAWRVVFCRVITCCARVALYSFLVVMRTDLFCLGVAGARPGNSL